MGWMEKGWSNGGRSPLPFTGGAWAGPPADFIAEGKGLRVDVDGGVGPGVEDVVTVAKVEGTVVVAAALFGMSILPINNWRFGGEAVKVIGEGGLTRLLCREKQG